MAYIADVTIKNTKASLDTAPTTIGVYVYKQENKPLYIGKAINLRARLKSHRQNAISDTKEALIQSQTDTIDIIYAGSEFLALVLESELIGHFKPKYNVRWRDDKSYLYIKINSRNTYPTVQIVRKEDDGVSTYFGPFDSSRSVENLVKSLRNIVPFCTQKSLGKRPCFYHKLGLCNPCPSTIHMMQQGAEKTQLKRIYRSHMRTLMNMLSGRTDKVFHKFHRDIKRLTRQGEYERAMVIRDAMRRLEMLLMQGSFIRASSHVSTSITQPLSELELLLKPYMPHIPSLHRIECYDNSTLSLSHTTASMVVCTDGRMDKKEYKRFKLSHNLKSDFEMMQEVIHRRLRHATWPKPDLIVIDGGKPQLESIIALVRANKLTPTAHGLQAPEHEKMEDIPLIGIAKDPDRIIVGIPGYPIIRPPRTNAGFRLIQLMRNEAHRFAKKYHVHLRRKALHLV